MFNTFRVRHEHIRLPQRESESHDSDTLLPASSSSTSLTLKPILSSHSSRDVQVAMRTLILCTIVYVGAATWIAFSTNKITLLANADDFCIHHISRYCKWERDMESSRIADRHSTGRQRCEAELALAVVQWKLLTSEHISPTSKP